MFLGVVLAAGIVATGLANCASPTQIVIDVRADPAMCKSLSTGIAVGSRATVDSTPLEEYQEGCDGPDDRVGTLTITPSAANDAVVAIRIVGAVNGNKPDRCGRVDPETKREIWDDCVLARRIEKFIPGKTVNLTVRLAQECVGQYCGGELECNLGVCVKPEQVQDDGGNTPPPDSAPPIEEDVVVPPMDAPVDAPKPVDAGFDACSDCKGNCNAQTGDCTVNCTGTTCVNQVVCGGNLKCTINCNAANVCDRARCDTNNTCAFNCTGGQGNARCPSIQCSALACNVSCSGAERTCNRVSMDASILNDMTCGTSATNTPTCDNVECNGGLCKRQCLDGGLGCGTNARCAGNCSDWEDGGDGGDGAVVQ